MKKQITKEELNKILDNHKKWLSGKGGERADLRGADLSGTDLRDVDLSYAELSEVDFSGADLRGANLSRGNLSEADLSVADLSGAHLFVTNLSGAYLFGTNLSGAYLSRADLQKANLSEADLFGTDLDYSCLPLWCGSLSAHFDDRQIKQIAYHLVKAGLQSKNTSEETKKELAKLIDFANGFHRANECGLIQKPSDKEKRKNDL